MRISIETGKRMGMYGLRKYLYIIFNVQFFSLVLMPLKCLCLFPCKRIADSALRGSVLILWHLDAEYPECQISQLVKKPSFCIKIIPTFWAVPGTKVNIFSALIAFSLHFFAAVFAVNVILFYIMSAFWTSLPDD